MQHRIEFEKLDWEQPQIGARQKVYEQGLQRIRLIRFTEGYIAQEWCTNAHIGFVLKGKLQIEFADSLVNYNQGDALWIEKGEAFKHRVVLPPESSVELLLFENIET